MKDRTRTQFRVTWIRKDCAPKSKLYQNVKQCERMIRILTSDEPWREFLGHEDDGPDAYDCCAGGRYSECGCGGLTVAQRRDERRKDLPPIESLKIEKRTITSTPFVEVERVQ